MRTQIQVLSEDEKAQVHERTLKVLSTVGLRCDTAEGRRILAAAGADVDEATRRVRFPAELVESLLAQATRSFTVHGRRPDWSFPVGAGEFTLLADGGATSVVDAVTGERRPTSAGRLAGGDAAARRHRRRRLLLVPHGVRRRLRAAGRVRALLHGRVRHASASTCRTRSARRSSRRGSRRSSTSCSAAPTRCASACPCPSSSRPLRR